jgi:hypothetical protein
MDKMDCVDKIDGRFGKPDKGETSMSVREFLADFLDWLRWGSGWPAEAKRLQAASMEVSVSVSFETSYAKYVSYRIESDVAFSENKPQPCFEVPKDVILRLANPTGGDIDWVTSALKHNQGRKFFIAEVARKTKPLHESFFEPMLEAGIDIYGEIFIKSCIGSFGLRRVNDYLLAKLTSPTISDSRKIEVLLAMYHAQGNLDFGGIPSSDNIAEVIPESRLAYEALNDLWMRRRIALLEIFVSTTNKDLRNRIARFLNVDPADYPESHRALVEQAIEIAHHSKDKHIRQSIEDQLLKIKQLSHLSYWIKDCEAGTTYHFNQTREELLRKLRDR